MSVLNLLQAGRARIEDPDHWCAGPMTDERYCAITAIQETYDTRSMALAELALDEAAVQMCTTWRLQRRRRKGCTHPTGRRAVAAAAFARAVWIEVKPKGNRHGRRAQAIQTRNERRSYSRLVARVLRGFGEFVRTVA